MASEELTEEQRVRAGNVRMSPSATDHDYASAFVFGCGNMYRDGVAVRSLEALMVQVRADERRKVAKLLGREANRVFNKQEKDYPSNVLDRVGYHLSMGRETELTASMDHEPKKEGA